MRGFSGEQTASVVEEGPSGPICAPISCERAALEGRVPHDFLKGFTPCEG